jgi:hypothetical protein
VGEDAWLGRCATGSSTGTIGVGDADFFGDGVAEAFVFFFGEGLGDAFAVFFFFGVGVFFAVAFFFLGDALGFGVGDLAGLGEAFAMF